MYKVSFPGLGIDGLEIDSVAFTLPIKGGIEIMWYALIITMGFITAFLYAWYRSYRTEGYKVDDLLDMMIYVILFGVLGARLYYVIMSPSDFDSLKEYWSPICRKFLRWDMSEVFLMIKLVLWVLGRETREIKCHSCYVVSEECIPST